MKHHCGSWHCLLPSSSHGRHFCRSVFFRAASLEGEYVGPCKPARGACVELAVARSGSYVASSPVPVPIATVCNVCCGRLLNEQCLDAEQSKAQNGYF